MGKVNLTKGAVLILLILFVLSTLLFIIAGISYYTGADKPVSGDGKSTGLLLMYCALPQILLTAILFFLYIRIIKKEKLLKKKEKDKEKIIGFLRMYRRVSLSDLAYNLNIPKNEAEEILLEMIANGEIIAHIDRNTKEIFMGETTKDMHVENIKCPNCGNTVSGLYLVGEVVKCPYCNTVFKVEE